MANIRFRFARVAKRGILDHRGAFSSVALICEKFLRTYYNQDNFDFYSNGENGVIKKGASHFRPNLFVMDIGANKGDWAAGVLRVRPDSTVYCFEIIPTTASFLANRLSQASNAKVFAFGLSSQAREIDVHFNPAADDASTITPDNTNELFKNSKSRLIRCKTETGDQIVTKLGIPRIDFMKIDVEGHEVDVILGFSRTLDEPVLRPSIIQFEYGVTYIPAHRTLSDVYDLLQPRGYSIGRIYPKGVAFKPYELGDEHYRMGNYLAVRSDLVDFFRER